MSRYWLFKTEPGAYSIDDLAADETTCWEGIRNYQARNYIRDDMAVGDLVVIYHSSVKIPAAVGLARIITTAYPDDTAWEEGHRYFDPKSSPETPIWFRVDLEFTARFDTPVPLTEIKANPDLDGIAVARRGIRLSIQPLSQNHFHILRKLGLKKA